MILAPFYEIFSFQHRSSHRHESLFYVVCTHDGNMLGAPYTLIKFTLCRIVSRLQQLCCFSMEIVALAPKPLSVLCQKAKPGVNKRLNYKNEEIFQVYPTKCPREGDLIKFLLQQRTKKVFNACK